jgi:hypothetical protein
MPGFMKDAKTSIIPVKKVKYPATDKSILRPEINTPKKSFQPKAKVFPKLNKRNNILNRIK